MSKGGMLRPDRGSSLFGSLLPFPHTAACVYRSYMPSRTHIQPASPRHTRLCPLSGASRAS